MYVNASGQACLEKDEFVERMGERLRKAHIKRAAEEVRAMRVEHMRRTHRLVGLTREQRKAMGASCRGVAVSWTPEAVALLGTMSDARVAEIIGCGPTAVYNERTRRGIPPMAQRRVLTREAREASAEARRRRWTDEEAALLGTMSDYRVAKLVGCSVTAVCKERERRGIPRAPRGGEAHA